MESYMFLFPINYKEKTWRRSTPPPHTHHRFCCTFCCLSVEFLRTNRKFEKIVDFEPTPKSSKNQHFQKPLQNTKSQTVRRQGLDFETDLDDFWHPFFHHFSRPPNFHTLQQSSCQTRFLTRYSAWICDQKSIKNIFFYNVFGTSFFSLLFDFL